MIVMHVMHVTMMSVKVPEITSRSELYGSGKQDVELDPEKLREVSDSDCATRNELNMKTRHARSVFSFPKKSTWHSAL